VEQPHRNRPTDGGGCRADACCKQKA